MQKTKNLAHRGFSGKYPENSPIAFIKAKDVLGCHGFESDVHLSKDSEPVIIHDPTLERTTDGKGSVQDKTFLELQKLDCGRWMGEEFAGQRIWHLKELLEFIKEHDLFLNLEIKNYDVFYENIEEIVIKTIKDVGVEDSVILSSFNHHSMAICKDIDPNIKTGLLYSYNLIKPEVYAKNNNIDALHPGFKTLYYNKDSGMVKRAHDAGIQVNTWTVNTKEEMRFCLEQKVDSIITNYPDLLSEVMEKFIKEEQVE